MKTCIMRIVSRLVFLSIIVMVLFSSGCATIVTGKYEKIPVTSEPPGVTVRSSTGERIITPGSFTLRRNEDHTLVGEYPGAEPQQVQLKHGLQGWFWGNILVGGIIGGVVDLASGSSCHLQPKNVHFDFTHMGQNVAERRRAYLEAHPETKEEIVFAITHGLTAKNMTKQELVASLGPPSRNENSGEYVVYVYEGRTPSSYYLKDNNLVEAK